MYEDDLKKNDIREFFGGLRSFSRKLFFSLQEFLRCLDMQKVDKDMENEAKLMAMAEYMESHIGEEFEAYITDISRNGMFVITKDSIPGKVKITDILDDSYYYDENKNILVGRNNDNKYRIGNKAW